MFFCYVVEEIKVPICRLINTEEAQNFQLDLDFMSLFIH